MDIFDIISLKNRAQLGEMTKQVPSKTLQGETYTIAPNLTSVFGSIKGWASAVVNPKKPIAEITICAKADSSCIIYLEIVDSTFTNVLATKSYSYSSLTQEYIRFNFMNDNLLIEGDYYYIRYRTDSVSLYTSDTATYSTNLNSNMVMKTVATGRFENSVWSLFDSGSFHSGYGTYLYQQYFKVKYIEDITSLDRFSKVITVGANGCDYTTITDAVDASTEDDLILLSPGIYEESVSCRDKIVHVQGISKEKCIVKNYTSNYYTPPFDVSRGSIKNLTIIADKNREYTEADKTTLKSYAIHCDADQSTNGEMIIENCTLVSFWSSALGIGLRSGFTLKIKKCEIVSKDTIAYADENRIYGALFMHNGADGGTQKMIIDDCRLYSYNKNTLRIGEPYDTGDNQISLINNLYWSYSTSAHGVLIPTTTTSGMITGNHTKITGDSYGNSLTLTNNP